MEENRSGEISSDGINFLSPFSAFAKNGYEQKVCGECFCLPYLQFHSYFVPTDIRFPDDIEFSLGLWRTIKK